MEPLLDSVRPNPDSASSRSTSWRALTTLCGIYAILAGLVVIAGWVLDLPRLTDWMGQNISTFMNTAVCAISCGLALLGLVHNRPKYYNLGRIFAALVAVIGGLTLIEHLTGLNLGIDTLLMHRDWGQAASMAPMRMGPPACSSFLCLGVAAILATFHERPRRLAATLAVVPVAIASLSLAGYLFNSDRLFGVARYTGIAWPTTTMVIALGIGLIAALPEYGIAAVLSRRDAGGLVARRLMLPLVAIPLLLGWVCVGGQRAGWYDSAFGMALLVLSTIAMLMALLSWAVIGISREADVSTATRKALQESEVRFSRFMQSLPGLAWIKDLQGRYVYANDAALTAFRVSREELYGKTDDEIFDPETAHQFRHHDAEALDFNGVQVIETLQHSDGTLHSSIVSKFVIPGQDGGATLLGGIAIDITDRIRAEEALRDADRRKDVFLATLAHELRNPLAPIRYAIQILKENCPPEHDLEWAIDIIDRQGQQMSRLLDDLLDISRISYNKLQLRREPVLLQEIVQRTVETCRPLIEKGQHQVAVSLPPEPVELEADPIRLVQILSNLVNNAAKFTRQPGLIRVSAQFSAPEVEISVADNGIGIAADMLDQVFDTFAQVAGAQEQTHGGLGIGLSLVRGLVELHGGSIEARSEGLGCGSEFILRLPARYQTAGPGAPPPKETQDHHKYRILIADDHRDGAESLSRVMKSMGHEVHLAFDGEEALARAAELKPEIMLLDIGMPKLNGNEVCRQIREQPWGVDIFMVAITGWGQAADRLRTREAGFNHHLTKPVAIGELKEVLASRADSLHNP